MEGLHQTDIPLIEVFDSGKNKTLKFPVKSLCAVVSDKPITSIVPNFRPKDINRIANFLETFNE
jgi:hypothetical protein